MGSGDRQVRAWVRVFTNVALICWLAGGASVVLSPSFAQQSGSDIPTATAARLGGDVDRTRFVVDLSEAIGFSVYVLPDPFRVIVDLPEVNFQLPPGLGSQGHGIVTAYRYGLFEPGKSRIVLDSSEPVLIETSFVLQPEDGQPARLVIDLIRTDRETYLRIHELVDPTQEEDPDTQVEVQPDPEPETPAEPDLPESLANAPVPLPNPLRTGELNRAQIEAAREALRIAQEGPRQRIVVIDPGHGGVDPGAVGRDGTTEKRVVFAFAEVLRDLLVATGRYEVFMTRNEDTFVRLGERVDLARSYNGDVFVAIHADAIRQRSVRGATVYTLSERGSDREAEELASRENRADLIAGVELVEENDEVWSILLDLAQRETNNLSVHFARTIVEELDGTTRLTGTPHRTAGFRVLKAPDIPSVLVELGYISNREDENLLRSESWRDKVATAIRDAIDKFFNMRSE